MDTKLFESFSRKLLNTLIIIIIYFLPLIFTDIEQVNICIVCMAFVVIHITSLSLNIHKKHTIQSKILITTEFRCYLRKSIYKLVTWHT